MRKESAPKADLPALSEGSHVQVKFENHWRDAVIERPYDNGADCNIGEHGCWYVLFTDMRRVPS